jgi:KDO2-lipid IV(A) lauroyltransferase
VAEAVGYALGRLPLPSGGPVAAAVGGRRTVVARNLRRVYGPGPDERAIAGLVGETFASYARYWAESLRLPSVASAEVDAGMTLHGFDHIERALAAGRGVIAAIPHLGGWDWGGRFLGGAGYPTSVVVEALSPPEVFEWFVGFRRRLGVDVIAVGPGAGPASLRALADNRILCLLSDRIVGSVPGVDVDFFGERTRLPAGPVTLALRTGAPIVPLAVYFGRRTDDHVAIIRPPLDLTRRGRLREDVARGTQALAGELEHLIRLAPTQWHLMQPNWPSDANVPVGEPDGRSSPR